MSTKLNANNFQELTKESVLRNRNVLEFFRYYIPDFKEAGKRFNSPLREDKNPSCVIYESGLYLDFGSGERYDIFSFIQKKYSCNFYEALRIINNDFNLKLGDQIADNPIIFGIRKKKEILIEYKSKPFTKKALDYYVQYGITKDILETFFVKQIECYWINKQFYGISANEIGIIYPEVKIDKWVYKIYLPERDKRYRFPASNDGGAIYGYRQLPETGDHLFITSSKKDIMTLYSLGYPSVSGNSETVLFTTDLFDHLKSRFKKISVFYDYDDEGIKRSNLLKDSYDLNGMLFTEDRENKDPSDFYKNIGKEKLEWKIKKYLEEI